MAPVRSSAEVKTVARGRSEDALGFGVLGSCSKKVSFRDGRFGHLRDTRGKQAYFVGALMPHQQMLVCKGLAAFFRLAFEGAGILVAGADVNVE